MSGLEPDTPPGPPVTWVWTGELDAGDAPALRSAWRRLAVHDPCRVTVDLAAVTFLDCAVLSVLLQVRRVLGPRLVLRAVPGHVARLFELAGVAGVLGHRASSGAAVPR